MVRKSSGNEDLDRRLRAWAKNTESFEPLGDALYAPAVMSDLAGQLMVRGKEARLVKLDRGPASAFLDLPWEDALDAFRERVPTRKNELERLLAAYAQRSDEARRLALEQIQKYVKMSLESHIRDGGTFRDFAQDIDDGKVTLGITADDPSYLKMVFRTNVQSAYGAGRFRALTDPEVVDGRPYVQYRTVGDARVRPEHAVLDRNIYSATSDEWHRVAPPNSYNCRCSMVSLSRDEVGDAKVLSQVPKEYVGTPEFDSPPTPRIEEPANDNARELSRGMMVALTFDPSQARADDGKWTDGFPGTAKKKTTTAKPKTTPGTKSKPAKKPAEAAAVTKPARKRKTAAEALAEIKARLKAKADREADKKAAPAAAKKPRKKVDEATVEKAKDKVRKAADAAKKKRPVKESKPKKPTADEREAAKKAAADKKSADKQAAAKAKAEERVRKLAEKMRAKQAKDAERERAKQAKRDERAAKERQALDESAKKSSKGVVDQMPDEHLTATSRALSATPIKHGAPNHAARSHITKTLESAIPGLARNPRSEKSIKVGEDVDAQLSKLAGGATAGLDSDGVMMLRSDVAEILKHERPSSGPNRATWDYAFQVSLHEELHDYGPVAGGGKYHYRGAGAVIEEATTEGLSRHLVYGRRRPSSGMAYDSEIQAIKFLLSQHGYADSHDEASDLFLKAAAHFKRAHTTADPVELLVEGVVKHSKAKRGNRAELLAGLRELRLESGYV